MALLGHVSAEMSLRYRRLFDATVHVEYERSSPPSASTPRPAPATTTLHRVERTCLDLARAGQPITIVAIAERAGIARSTIYRSQALRAVIERQPDHGPPYRSLAG